MVYRGHPIFRQFRQGERGVTQPCVDAIKAIAASIDQVQHVVLISYQRGDETGGTTFHGFVVFGAHVTVVRDGFASGYSGTGPHGLVEALGELVVAFERAGKFWGAIRHAWVPEGIAEAIFERGADELSLRSWLKDCPRYHIAWSPKMDKLSLAGQRFLYVSPRDWMKRYWGADSEFLAALQDRHKAELEEQSIAPALGGDRAKGVA